MKGKAVKIIRDRAMKTTLRNLALKHGMSAGYFQDATGRDGERVHNAVLRFPHWFPADVVEWAKETAESRRQGALVLREQNRKMKNQAPVARQKQYSLPNYPSPHPQPFRSSHNAR